MLKSPLTSVLNVISKIIALPSCLFIRYWRVGKIRKSGIVQWPEQMPSAVWPSSNEEIGENKPEVIFLTRHEPHMNPNS